MQMLTKQHSRDEFNLLTKTMEHSIEHDLTNRYYSNMLNTYTLLHLGFCDLML